MAEPHEQGPESLRGDDTSTPLDNKRVPDCSNCLRSWQLLTFLETREGPFEMTEDTREHLLKVLRNASDLGAFAVEIANQGICPFVMLEIESLEKVMFKIAVGSCKLFDDTYRPGQDLAE